MISQNKRKGRNAQKKGTTTPKIGRVYYSYLSGNRTSIFVNRVQT